MRQRMERATLFNQAVGEAEAFTTMRDDQAMTSLDGRELATRHTVERFLVHAPDEGGRARATVLVREVTAGAAAAENIQRLLARLVEIRGMTAEDYSADVLIPKNTKMPSAKPGSTSSGSRQARQPRTWVFSRRQ